MSYDAMLQQALKLQQDGKFDEAEQLYRRVLEAVPDNGHILYMLGLIALAKGLNSQAINYLTTAISKNMQDEGIYFNLGWAYENSNKFAEAIDAYKMGLKFNSNVKEAYNSLGNIYRKLGSEAEARENYMIAVALDPDYAEAMINLEKDNFEELMLLRNKYPIHPLLYMYLSAHYIKKNDLNNALIMAKQADAIFEDEEIKLRVGSLLFDLGKHEEAKPYFQQALRLNPKSVTALINLANMEDDFSYAEKLYKQAINISPDDFDAHMNYADMLYRNNRLHEALEEYRKAVIINPNVPEVSNNLGILLRDMKEYEEALGLFFNAFVRDTERKDYALNIYETLVMLHSNDAKTAKKIAENWLNHAPENIFAKHINAAFKGKDDKYISEYSQELFDAFADNFEEVMQRIDYTLPKIIADELGEVKGTVIDLGCGTGLVGQAIKNEHNEIIGIDISAAMLEKANAKHIYNELVQSDIADYCKNMPKADMVIAADVFGYIGDIEQIIGQIKNSNICFSIAVDKSCENFCMKENGRYVHNPDYVNKLLKKYGYSDIVAKDITIRKENNKDVDGVLFVAKGV